MKKRQFQISSGKNLIYYDPIEGVLSKDKTIITLHQPHHPVTTSVAQFVPECLTIFAHSICNLKCTYCYGTPDTSKVFNIIDLKAVEAATDYVASYCAAVGRPFIMGFHGDNELLLYPEHIADCLRIGQQSARKRNLLFRSFCTTNGVIPEKTVQWASDNFNGITVSCDGPSWLHDAVRRKKDGSPTSHEVERTLGILCHSNRAFLRVRATLTRENVRATVEIVEYLAALGVTNIEMFPVYRNNRGEIANDLKPEADELVYGLLSAIAYGRRLGVNVSCFAVRVYEKHGRFCYPLQKNLAVTVDGYVTGCFLSTYQLPDDTVLGPVNRLPDMDGLSAFFEKTMSLPVQCQDCFNRYHCSMGCPDICPFRDDLSQPFNCDWLKWLSLAKLLVAAGVTIPLESPGQLKNYLEGWSIKVG